MTQTVEEATKALWDYIDGLPAEQRDKAILYQRGLEAEACVTPGGMAEVIPARLKQASKMLQGAMTQLEDIGYSVITASEINNIMKL